MAVRVCLPGSRAPPAAFFFPVVRARARGGVATRRPRGRDVMRCGGGGRPASLLSSRAPPVPDDDREPPPSSQTPPSARPPALPPAVPSRRRRRRPRERLDGREQRRGTLFDTRLSHAHTGTYSRRRRKTGRPVDHVIFSFPLETKKIINRNITIMYYHIRVVVVRTSSLTIAITVTILKYDIPSAKPFDWVSYDEIV